MPIDTLKAAKRLKELGFDEEQSEGVAELLSDLDVASATKGDLDDLEEHLKGDLDELEERLKGDLDDLEERLKGDLSNLEERLRTEMDAQEERIKRELIIRIYGAAAFVTAVLTIVNYLMG